MNSFKKVNISMGWIAFLLSLLVYIATLEPSASLWDCSEFISTSYKMEIGHPPGAPLFMMINRFFTMFAPDVTSVAWLVNLASATASALTIMFLYWTIAHLGLKLVGKTRETAETKDILLVCGSAFVGSMAYAFTDTFWFSAVEGEVYAQSSLFTALVVWAMLKWENESENASSFRWLILIAYLMGLSIGVHLLNLLSIPTLVMIYYYKTTTNRTKLGWWKAFIFSIFLLAAVLFVVIPKSVVLGAWFDRLFVNSFGFEKNIGFLFFVVALFGTLGFLTYFTHKRNLVIWNKVILCLSVLMVGYGTYASVIIRSSANPPMNSNHPDDAYSLLSFLSREQYGDTPLITGPYFSSPTEDWEQDKQWYYDEDEKVYKYIMIDDQSSISYAKGTTTLMPRMHDSSYTEAYKSWITGDMKSVKTKSGIVQVPTFAQNLEFFFKYQINYMYWRYFLWNFVGRQNDRHGDASVMNGNWISGIDFIDELYLGSQDYLPEDLANTPSRNTYFFLPFLLGIAGLVFQLGRRKDDFVIVSFLFLMTGLAIIFYLNQTPNQVRERDYAYAGSFYAFSIWIGLGVFWVQSTLSKLIKSQKSATLAAILVSLSVPTILLAQNWDDHNRSHRYIAPDFGKNYLESTLPNSILLTYGDNDTFGPWYSQEVEDVRTDVRICNLSYMQSNWYALQMRYKYNKSLPIDFTIPARVYGSKGTDIFPVMPLSEGYTPIKDVLNFIANDTPAKKNLIKSIGYRDGIEEIFPANKIAIPVNKENALKAGIIKEEDLPNVVDTIFIDIKKNLLQRHEYLLLDMIATADWSRPIYLTQTSNTVGELGLSDYFQFDGFSYRLVPIKTAQSQLASGRIDTDYLYNIVKNKLKFGNISDPRVYIDVYSSSYIKSTQLRNVFSRLAIELAKEGKKDKASEIIMMSLEKVPFSKVPHDYFSPKVIEALYVSGHEKEAEDMMDDAIEYYMGYMQYFSSIGDSNIANVSNDLNISLQTIYLLYQTAVKLKFEEQAKILGEYASLL